MVGPGARFAYSNTGYVLMALALEAVEAEPIEQLAARRLFRPLAKSVRIPEQRVAVAVLSHDSDEDAISRLGTKLAEQLATTTPT